MNDILIVFFLACGAVAIGIIWYGIVHLIASAGSTRENALWVARGVLILGLLWWLLS